MATAELIFHLARLACVPVDRDMHLSLYRAHDRYGVVYVRGTRAYLHVARDLLAGATRRIARARIYFGHSTPRCSARARAFHLHRGGSLLWIWGDARTDAALRRPGRRLRGLVNYALSMADAQVAFFFASSRMAVMRQPAQQRRGECLGRAEHFGGGGHKCASGCSIDGPLAVACPELSNWLHEDL